MALRGTRDQVFLNSFGSPPPTIRPDAGYSQHLGQVGGASYDQQISASQTFPSTQGYIPLNPEIAKAYVIAPTNQGQRAAVASRESMMHGPANNPSRSQFMTAYTDPLQQFASHIAWSGGEGSQVQSGQRTKQPNQKAVSPFESLPIPTRMPWDV